MPHVVQFNAPRDVRLVADEPRPLTPTDVRVATWYSGISAGTELTAYRGSNPCLSSGELLCAVAEEREPEHCAAHAAGTVRLVLAALRSAEQGGAPTPSTRSRRCARSCTATPSSCPPTATSRRPLQTARWPH